LVALNVPPAQDQDLDRLKQDQDIEPDRNVLDPEFPIWPSDSRIARFSCPGYNEFATRADPREIAGFRQLVFARLTTPACCCAIDFSDNAPAFLA
jgi:hypothetical protein